jgi:hypothetical protein
MVVLLVNHYNVDIMFFLERKIHFNESFTKADR